MEEVKRELTISERRNIRDERLKRKQEKAKESNSMVVSITTKRVNTAVNLLTQTDLMMSRVQDRTGDEISYEDAAKIYNTFRDIVFSIEDLTIEMARVTKSKYFQSTSLENTRKRLEVEEPVKEIKTKK